MPTQSAHDWLQPKLATLVAEADAAGIDRDIAVAVITDIINGPLFSPPVPKPDDEWARDVGEPDDMINENVPLSAEPSLGAPVQNRLARTGQENGRY